MEKLYFVLLTFVISIAIGWVTIPRIVIIAKMKRLFDKPDQRKVHSEEIPRLGGVSFFPAMMVSVTLMLGFRYYFDLALPLTTEVNFMSEFMFLTSAMFLIFFVGLSDDLVGVGYKYKFLAQVMAGSMLYFAGVMPTGLFGVFGLNEMPTWFMGMFMVGWVVFVVNAYNLIDGVDGLCSGLSSIALFFFGVWFVYMSNYIFAMIAFGMLGVVMIFFRFNVMGTRMKVFMGDTGSLTLGFLIVFLSLKFLQPTDPAYEGMYVLKSPMSIVLGLLFIPIFDTVRVFISRIRDGKSPFYPDKTHIHHKMLALGFSHLKSTAVLLISQIVFVMINVLLAEVLALNINIVIGLDLVIAIGINVGINRGIKNRQLNMKLKLK